MHLRGSAPRTNRVAQLNAFGPRNVAIVERPLPEIEPGEVRVRVHAASLNHRDLGMLSGAAGTFDALPILAKTLRLQGIVGGSVEMLERLSGTIEALGIRPVIDRTFEMEDVVAALKYIESGRHIGKIIVRVNGSEPAHHGATRAQRVRP